MHLKFKKEKGTWYIVLKNWIGPKEALAMIANADVVLDMYSDNTNEVELEVTETFRENADLAAAIKDDIYNYQLLSYKGKDFDLKFWLCPVTLFVFDGHYPKFLFINKVCQKS